MKVIGLKETTLDACVSDAQEERVLITRNGKPAALVVGVEGLDAEQLELAGTGPFWELIQERRRQPTYTRAQLEREVHAASLQTPAAQGNAAPARVSSARKKRLRQKGPPALPG